MQILAVLSIIGIIYGALVSLMQKDWKKLVAYSSVSHLGFCTLGIFAMNPNGIAGSVMQQINHGISTGMLFLVIGVIYERRHTREISEYGGLAHVMPKYAIVFAIAMLSSAGLPLLNGFVGEFTILQGAFEANRIWAAFAVTGVILGAAYLLWLYQRTMLGQVTNGKNLHLPDLNLREMAMFLPLIAWAIWIGVYPKPYFDILEKPVAADRGARPARILSGQPAALPNARPRVARREARNEPVLHHHRSLRPSSRRSCWRCSAAPSCCSISWSFPIRGSASGCCSSWCWPKASPASALMAAAGLPGRQRQTELHGLRRLADHGRLRASSSTGSSWLPR